jgi:hypothetical protein
MSEQPSRSLRAELPQQSHRLIGGRSRARLLAYFLLAISVVILISASVWGDRYQPLSQSLGGGYGSQILTMNGKLAHNTNGTLHDLNIPGTIWNEPADSYKAAVQFTLNNSGPLAVTVDRVLDPWTEGYNTHFQTFFDSRQLDEGFYGYRGGPIFHSTTLPSHDELTLVLHWTARCIPGAGTTTTMSSVQVTCTFLNFQHTVSVPIKPFEIKYRPNC